jgi:hypothetical protein
MVSQTDDHERHQDESGRRDDARGSRFSRHRAVGISQRVACPLSGHSPAMSGASASMRMETFATEALKCRRLARRYTGRPEQLLLMNVAAAFEQLAQKQKSKHRPN